jgi:acetyl-CoA synthetase (ADP-forming)
MTAMFIRGHDLGIGFSACISVGNQADLELADAFEYLVDDEATGAICLYVEGMKDRDRFSAAAQRARKMSKPVIAVKAGRTRAGAEMANSHTGSLAGSYEGFQALCRRLGVLVTDNTEAAVPCADALARHGVLRAPGLAVLSSSGGAAVLASDAVAARPGLEAAELAPETREAIAAMTPQPVHTAMIDFGGYHRPFLLHEISRTLDVLAADPAVGAMVYVMTPQPLMPEVGAVIADLVERTGVPIAFVSTAGSVADAVHEELRGRGIPVFTSMDDALRVLGALVQYHHLAHAHDQAELPALEFSALDGAVAEYETGLLTEPEAKAMLAAAELSVTRERMAHDAASARSVAASIGFPVVLKAVARGLIHKSDAGAVKLDLDSDSAVAVAFEEIAGAVAGTAPDADFEGCLVQEMATGGVIEAFVGARFDPQHGPMVLAGIGGVFVEIFDDVVVLAAPVSPGEVLTALKTLAGWPLFEGARGRPVADAVALADFVSRVSLVAAHLGSRLAELDVNPVLVRERGNGVLALDARAIWS